MNGGMAGLLFSLLLVAVVGVAVAVTGREADVHYKRGAGQAFSYAQVIHDHGRPSTGHYKSGGHAQDAVIHVTKQVPYPVLQPYAITVEKHIPYPVSVPVAVPVDRPYPVHVPKPYLVPVERPVSSNSGTTVSRTGRIPGKISCANPGTGAGCKALPSLCPRQRLR
ncbi:uncharacterized protein LOC124353160 [Homalodisca vitripennis]|uniref:uncharacterized protein LOC124353160 n=1 Tax=Homalodisca vitripennis TaxID=197043 RepID=UPI001EEBCA8B|nr:uncharacterized protein LOC124353160 [Homalodisca vitripennis]